MVSYGYFPTIEAWTLTVQSFPNISQRDNYYKWRHSLLEEVDANNLLKALLSSHLTFSIPQVQVSPTALKRGLLIYSPRMIGIEFSPDHLEMSLILICFCPSLFGGLV